VLARSDLTAVHRQRLGLFFRRYSFTIEFDELLKPAKHAGTVDHARGFVRHERTARENEGLEKWERQEVIDLVYGLEFIVCDVELLETIAVLQAASRVRRSR
jgi:hypothetical protein